MTVTVRTRRPNSYRPTNLAGISTYVQTVQILLREDVDFSPIAWRDAVSSFHGRSLREGSSSSALSEGPGVQELTREYIDWRITNGIEHPLPN